MTKNSQTNNLSLNTRNKKTKQNKRNSWEASNPEHFGMTASAHSNPNVHESNLPRQYLEGTVKFVFSSSNKHKSETNLPFM